MRATASTAGKHTADRRRVHPANATRARRGNRPFALLWIRTPRAPGGGLLLAKDHCAPSLRYSAQCDRAVRRPCPAPFANGGNLHESRSGVGVSHFLRRGVQNAPNDVGHATPIARLLLQTLSPGRGQTVEFG